MCLGMLKPEKQENPPLENSFKVIWLSIRGIFSVCKKVWIVFMQFDIIKFNLQFEALDFYLTFNSLIKYSTKMKNFTAVFLWFLFKSAACFQFSCENQSEPAALCPDVSLSWNTGLYVNLLTSSFSSFLRPNNSPTTSPTPICPLVCLASGSDTQYPHCVAVLQRGGEKRAYISNLCRALLFSVRTQRNDSPACSNSRGNTTVTIELPATCYFWESGQFLHLLIHLILILHTY